MHPLTRIGFPFWIVICQENQRYKFHTGYEIYDDPLEPIAKIGVQVLIIN